VTVITNLTDMQIMPSSIKVPVAMLFGVATTLCAQEPTNLTSQPLAKASGTLPGNRGDVKTGIVKIGKNEALVFSANGRDITLETNEKPITERGIPLHLEMVKAQGIHGPDYLKLNDFTARSVGQWLDFMGADYLQSGNPLKVRLYKETLLLRDKINQNITEHSNNQDWKGLAVKYSEIRNLIGEIYVDERDWVKRARLAFFQNDLLEEELTFVSNKLSDPLTTEQAQAFVAERPPEEKRFYDMNDNYRPAIYPMIQSRSASSFAIVEKNSDHAIGSGVLIAPDLVLTCRHNIDEGHAKDFDDTGYEIWTDYEENSAVTRDQGTWLAKEVYRSEKLDFVLLEIKQEDKTKITDRKPLELNTSIVRRWTPIIVVGYPRKARRTIHDSSWVLFPHEIRSKREMGEIQGEITKQLSRNGANMDARATAAASADQFMKGAYRKSESDPEVFTMMDGETPYIGIESDTFSGDSGAPVTLREGGSVIGILFKGVPDDGDPPDTKLRLPSLRLLSGPENHELVIPIRAILKDMTDNYSTEEALRTRGVKIIR